MFHDHDVICFLGDSITAAGPWCAEVYQVLKHKYDLKCYNCGISGGSADKAQLYLYRRCLHFNPDYVTVFFGINDIERWFYSDTYTAADKEEKIRYALEKHKKCYEWIVQQIIAFGAKPILCLPTPYDEASDKPSENLHCQCGMEESMAFVRGLAEKYRLPLVDLCTPFLDHMETLIGPDRVHPTPEGQHLIAQTILKTLGEIEEIDMTAPFVPEPWNEKRLNAERRLGSLNYVEFCDLFWVTHDNHWTLAEAKEEARRRKEKRPDPNNPNDFIARSYQDFIDNADFRGEFEEEVLRLTI